MRKSGTLGRTTSVAGDKTTSEEIKQQRPSSSKYDSQRQYITRKFEEKKKKTNSYGDSYGSGDECSYYSDYDEEEEKEQLQYDEQQEYASARLSPMQKKD